MNDVLTEGCGAGRHPRRIVWRVAQRTAQGKGVWGLRTQPVIGASVVASAHFSNQRLSLGVISRTIHRATFHQKIDLVFRYLRSCAAIKASLFICPSSRQVENLSQRGMLIDRFGYTLSMWYLLLQCHLADGSVFQPIGELLKQQGREVRALKPDGAGPPGSPGKPPPHALLPEDEAEEHPVSNANEGYVPKLQPGSCSYKQFSDQPHYRLQVSWLKWILGSRERQPWSWLASCPLGEINFVPPPPSRVHCVRSFLVSRMFPCSPRLHQLLLPRTAPQFLRWPWCLFKTTASGSRSKMKSDALSSGLSQQVRTFCTLCIFSAVYNVQYVGRIAIGQASLGAFLHLFVFCSGEIT